MKVILYMATSADGYIAGKNDDTSWVSSADWDNFRIMIKNIGVIVMGKRTYEESGEDFPYEGALNIVMTHDQALLKETENVIFTDIHLKR
ncbi:MAG: dihydrofolate reductase [bacterium]|nr:dihydrofolate reductase [bacterium]